MPPIETWLQLAQGLREHIQPHILERGIAYLADERVTALAEELVVAWQRILV
ncbi:MAG: hypothetical protein K6T63_16010 [Alicyclobacillus herbarius]|uniref:hypothetical protein n=1 Tax=Alicyclobacillus herbarius TaxID=122960 RepID=UPI002354D29A|nr:hypothetical protein [Alicyclobacillus herbarius]MCL6634116.1 hypothetical protein [Alicyclobacillus herbarius]